MEQTIRSYSSSGSSAPRKRVARPTKRTATPAPEAPAPNVAVAPKAPAAPVPAPKVGAAPKVGVAPRKSTRTATLPRDTKRAAPGGRKSAATATLTEVADALEVPGMMEPVREPAAHSEAGGLIGLADFEDIFTRFQTPLTNFVFRLVGNREQAYDLTQDVFVKAYRALAAGTTIQAGALSSWLYRIASNTATDALRRRRLISWLPLSLFNEDRGIGAGMPSADNTNSQQPPAAEENLSNAAGAFTPGYDGGRFEQHVADRDLVASVLKKLPPKYATCLLLYEHEGFSCAEIAEVLHVSPSAVKMRLMRARERFIELYHQEMSTEQH
ncbi:MAG: RNA polymerase sigma factor [Ktedonobacterales bacterium]|nr:RNA polymerase sigma factor [Ktedonobacterales bacterium]